MTKLTKSRPKTELQKVKDDCKAQGFDYNEIPLAALYDTLGNIIIIELIGKTLTSNQKKLKTILKGKSFIED